MLCGNPQLQSLRLDCWDEEHNCAYRGPNKCRFNLTNEVLESLCLLSCLHSLGLQLYPLSEEAGRSIAKAISPRLRMLVMHVDYEKDE